MRTPIQLTACLKEGSSGLIGIARPLGPLEVCECASEGASEFMGAFPFQPG